MSNVGEVKIKFHLHLFSIPPAGREEILVVRNFSQIINEKLSY